MLYVLWGKKKNEFEDYLMETTDRNVAYIKKNEYEKRGYRVKVAIMENEITEKTLQEIKIGFGIK